MDLRTDNNSKTSIERIVRNCVIAVFIILDL